MAPGHCNRQPAARRGCGLEPEPIASAAARPGPSERTPVHTGVGYGQQRKCERRDRREERHDVHHHVAAQRCAATVNHFGSRPGTVRRGLAGLRSALPQRDQQQGWQRHLVSHSHQQRRPQLQRSHRGNLARRRPNENRHLRPHARPPRALRDPRRQRQPRCHRDHGGRAARVQGRGRRRWAQRRGSPPCDRSAAHIPIRWSRRKPRRRRPLPGSRYCPRTPRQ